MPRRKKATPGQEPEAVAAVVEEAPEETPALPAEEPEPVVEVEIVVEEAAVVAEPEPAKEPEPDEAKPRRYAGKVATDHGWRVG